MQTSCILAIQPVHTTCLSHCGQSDSGVDDGTILIIPNRTLHNNVWNVACIDFSIAIVCYYCTAEHSCQNASFVVCLCLAKKVYFKDWEIHYSDVIVLLQCFFAH